MIDRLSHPEDEQPDRSIFDFLRQATEGEAMSEITIVFENGIRVTIDLSGGE